MRSGLILTASVASVVGQPLGTNVAIDWAKVSEYDSTTKLALMPRGCTCLQGSKTATTCTYFTCDCSCDLTAAKCDVGCCCDPDCSETEKAAFKIGVGCAVNPTANTRTRTCVDAKKVTKVNPKYRMRVETVADPFGDLLCVELDNSESLGEFFVDPGSQSADTVFLSNDNAKRQYEIEPVAYVPEASSSVLEFVAGDRLPALSTSCAAAGVTRCASGGGFLGLPAADFMGACNQRNYVGFLQPKSSSCMRGTTDLAAADSDDACVAGFSLDRYVSKLQVGESPNSITKLAQATLWKTVTLSSLTRRQFGTPPVDTTLPVSAPYPNTTLASGVCKDAVIEVQYTVTHSDAGVVSSVQAAVVLADVQASDVAVRQFFSVTYAGKAGSRPRSGNPGYTAGLPLLAGRMQVQGTKRAITERVGGLALMGASADGSCKTASSTPVAFNEDVRVGCTKKMNFAELEALCKTGQQNLIPAQLNVTDNFVGILGNSDPARMEEWLEIGGKWNDALGSLPTFTPETGVCKGLVTGLEYRVLYANIGAKTNPQRKVVAVTASYKTDTWHFMLENLNERQAFVLHSTVTFVEWGLQETKEFVPPAPPLMFSVPADVFYPFKLSAAHALKPSFGIIWLLSVAVCLALTRFDE